MNGEYLVAADVGQRALGVREREVVSLYETAPSMSSFAHFDGSVCAAAKCGRGTCNAHG